MTIDLGRMNDLYRGVLDDLNSIRVIERDPAGRALRIEVINSRGDALDRPSADRFRNDYNQGLSLSRQLLSSLWTSIRRTGGGVRVEGKGFGHGVGLCQYGAGGYAARGLDYRTILTHYYPGSQITRLDG